MEPVYPNKLLTDSKAAFAMKLSVMLFALCVIGFSIFTLHHRRKEINFLHPG